MRPPSLALLCLPLFVLAHASPQEVRKPAKVNPMSSETVQQGMSQFKQTCAMCHGTEAKGGSGPNLIDSSLVRHDENGNLIGKVIREGRAERGMPAFSSFNDAQVAALVEYLHAAVVANDNRSSGGPARGYSLQRLLTGNVDAGKQFFYGPGRCASCHSPTGDLAGVASRYSPTELEGAILYPRLASKTCVVSLPSGEKVKGTLLHLDAFFVAIQDEHGGYRSWPLKDHVTVQVADPLHAHMDLLNSYTDKDIHDIFAYLETLH
jgi:cytochrome c oxidase cbb3-type subunit III